MSEDTFSDLFQDTPSEQPNLQPGDKIEATVAGISGESVFLDIGAKSEGIIEAAELRDEDGNLTVKPGDTISAYLLANRKGEMVFTSKLGAGHSGLAELEEAFHSGIPVEGRVKGEIKGGFEVTVAGQRAFCPYSQMDVRRVEDAASYIDNSYVFKVIEFKNRGRNIIVSARSVLEEERQQQREELKKNLSEGDQVEGVVSSIRDFGAFVDIGGIDGLIPISELAWGQVKRVDDVLDIGQQVTVIVKSMDWERERISLSLKETMESPWAKAEEKYPEGSIHLGMISRLADFGAFVTLEPGVDGLVHISKLGAGRRINHPREVVEAGQEISVRIEGLDLEANKISLAPEDYDEAKAKPKSQQGERKKENRKPFVPEKPQSMGTLGDLFNRQLDKKK
jgi:small subunit ribosomal protein S1